MPKTIELKHDLVTHKGPVRSIELRDLTADDMIEVGTSPVQVYAMGTKGPVERDKRNDQKIDINYEIASKYLVRLSGIDRIVLGTMKGSDYARCVTEVVNLWNEAEGE